MNALRAVALLRMCSDALMTIKDEDFLAFLLIVLCAAVQNAEKQHAPSSRECAMRPCALRPCALRTVRTCYCTFTSTTKKKTKQEEDKQQRQYSSKEGTISSDRIPDTERYETRHGR